MAIKNMSLQIRPIDVKPFYSQFFLRAVGCFAILVIFSCCCLKGGSGKDPASNSESQRSASINEFRNSKPAELSSDKLTRYRRQKVRTLVDAKGAHRSIEPMGSWRKVGEFYKFRPDSRNSVADGAATDKMREGIRCPANMVISPYRPKAKPVPIKLLPPPPENVMICPYTQQKFIVPTEVQPVPPEEGGENRGSMESEPGIRPNSKPSLPK